MAIDNPAAAPESVTPGSRKLHIDKFLASLKGTEDEVYARLIRYEAKLKVMEAEAWKAMLDGVKARAAHPHHPDWQQTRDTEVELARWHSTQVKPERKR